MSSTCGRSRARDTIRNSLETNCLRRCIAFGIHYSHMPGLGGRRHARKDSTNTGWRNVSFRGYADYMETPAFKQVWIGASRSHSEERVVLMCAEAVPWRCHRSLIADALLARGVEVSEHHQRDARATSLADAVGPDKRGARDISPRRLRDRPRHQRPHG